MNDGTVLDEVTGAELYLGETLIDPYYNPIRKDFLSTRSLGMLGDIDKWENGQHFVVIIFPANISSCKLVAYIGASGLFQPHIGCFLVGKGQD